MCPSHKGCVYCRCDELHGLPFTESPCTKKGGEPHSSLQVVVPYPFGILPTGKTSCMDNEGLRGRNLWARQAAYLGPSCP